VIPAPTEPGSVFSIEPDERQVFVARMRATRPIVTVVILVALGLVFALEMLWGGAESNTVLARMGALMRARVLAGEWWRLMSSGMLHGGAMHVALNGYVLWVLGRGTEKLLGSARFLILYVTSALVAALGSALFLGDLSVGASGAIWGLLAAQAVFAYGARGYVPTVARPALQKGAATNLALNVVASFLPHVDWAAHFAGGLAGAALVASGLLLRGMPKLSEPDPGPGAQRRVARLAAALGVLYASGALVGILAGKAWQLRGPLEFVERALPEFHATVRLPDLVGEGVVEHDGGHTLYSFGDEAGPLRIAIQRSVDPVWLTGGLGGVHATLREQMSKVPEGTRVVSAPQTVEVEGRLVTEARSVFSWGAEYDVAAAVEPPYRWHVEVLAWPDYVERSKEVARKVAASLKTDEH
jgi:rhomboid protease GluP